MATERSKLTAEQILDVSIRLFSKRGYRTTRLIDVASELGVTQAALYNHFRSKEDILAAAFDRNLQCTIDKVQEAISRDIPPHVKFGELLRLHFELVAEIPEARSLFDEELRQINPERAKHHLVWRDQFAKLLEDLYAQGVASGHFLDFDPTVAVRVLFGASNWVHKWYRPGGRYNPSELALEALRLLADGFMPKSEERRDTAVLSQSPQRDRS